MASSPVRERYQPRQMPLEAGPDSLRNSRSQRRSRPQLLALTLSVILLIASSCGGSTPELSGAVRDPVLQVGNISLPVAASGEDFQFRADPGGILLVYFGYTFCPDICPTTMSDMSIAINDLDPAEAERVTAVFVTVDPERDTPEVLDNYLGSFFENNVAIRIEDPEALRSTATAFGVQFQVEEHEPGDTDYDVAHSAVTYVVDDTGAVAVEWPFGFEIENMATDMQIVLTKESEQ